MKIGPLLVLGLLLGISACREADSTVLVTVSINPDVPPVYSLSVAMSSAQAHDTKIYPAKVSATALPSGSSLVIILPRSRTGRLDLAVDGIDNTGRNVAHGATQAEIVVGGSAPASVVLAAGPSLCGNTVLDPGETCDDGNLFSFDGCDFQCQAEGSPADAAVPDSAMPETMVDGGAALAEVRGADAAGDLPAPSDLPSATGDLGRDAAQDLPGDLLKDAVDGPAVDKDARSDGGPVATDAAIDTTDSAVVPPDASGYPLGRACTAKEQCASGYCVDGVCCQSPCASVCMACNLPTAPGQCSMVPAGQDPRDICIQDPSTTCGRDGTCDGAGGCRRWIDGTVCADASCTNGMASTARACDGSGSCRSASTRTCAPYLCSGAACANQCANSTQCASIAWCKNSVCQGRTGSGGACSTSEECIIGYSCRMSVSDGITVCSQDL